jgi:hypothetical protein
MLSLVLFAAVIPLQQAPQTAKAEPLPTMAEIRKNLHLEIRKSSGYSDEWELKSGSDETLKYKRSLDGNRFKFEMQIPDKFSMAEGFDGKNHWMVSFLTKQYSEATEGNRAIDDESDLKPPADMEEHTFKFFMNGPYDVQLFASPDLTVKSLDVDKLDGKDVRKITCAAQGEKGELKVQLWLEKERWRLLKLAVSGAEHPDDVMTFTMISSSSNLKFDDAFFRLDESKIVGFEKMSGGAFPWLNRV